MCAKSKALLLVLFSALLLALLVLTTGPGEAVISKGERDNCTDKRHDCENDCLESTEDCGPIGSKDRNQCYSDCKAKCGLIEQGCLDDANKSAPKVPFKPKVQPKVRPGGVETPGTESPNVQPKGGIQRY